MSAAVFSSLETVSHYGSDASFQELSEVDVASQPHAEKVEYYCGPVRSFGELCRAYHLVQNRYLERGFAQDNDSGMRYSILNLIPQTTTFVVVHGKKVVGTLSIVIDSALGLPGESECKNEFDALRRKKKFLAEGTMFACEDVGASQALVAIELMALALAWCRHATIDDLCVVVNPVHVGFYERILGFERLGEPKTVAHVEGAPGQLMHLNIPSLRNKRTQNPQAAKLNTLAAAKTGQSMSRLSFQEVEAAVLLGGNPNILLRSSPTGREILERMYPHACVSVASWYKVESVDQ